MLLSIVDEKIVDYEQFNDIIILTRQNTIRQNIKNIIFMIISCCFIYAILSSLYFRQERVFNKNESLFIIEFLFTNEFLFITLLSTLLIFVTLYNINLIL